MKPLVLSLLKKIDELLAQNKALLARFADLEARASQPPKTPTNSSLPPSSGQKANVALSTARKTGRKGGPGVARELCPIPDATRDVYAECCACGTALTPADRPQIFAYDHIDLPPIKPITTRINLHRGQCPCCRKRVAASPPADMAPGSPFGPGIAPIVTYLHGCQMVSYSRMIEVLDGLFGLKLSEGAIANMLARAAKPFAARSAEIADIVRNSPVVVSDETSARAQGKTHWQWTFVAQTAVLHLIAPTEFLGDAKPKVWISDRFAAQGHHAEAHQYCPAHLIRDAQYAIDAGDCVFAPAFKAFLPRACAVGRRRPDLADATIAKHARDLQRDLDRLLDLKPTQADGRHLRDTIQVTARDKLLVFLRRRDVEPTNNVSERALRPAVIRKVTNGFRSGWRAKVYADLCSIVVTGRIQGRSPLAAIREALAPVSGRAVAA